MREGERGEGERGEKREWLKEIKNAYLENLFLSFSLNKNCSVFSWVMLNNISFDNDNFQVNKLLNFNKFFGTYSFTNENKLSIKSNMV